MANFYDGFDFIGELAIPNDDSRFLDVRDNGKGWIGHRLNFGIKESKFNSEFVELYGGYMNGAGAKNVVYSFTKGTRDKKGSSVQIPWESRLEQATVDMIADFAKIVVDFETDFEKKEKYTDIMYQIRNLEYEGNLDGNKKKELEELKAEFNELATNRKEFIHEYDAIQYLAENMKKYQDYKFRVQGQPTLDEWQGKYHTNFEAEVIELVPESYNNQLKLSTDIYFFADAVDRRSMKDGKIYVDGYMQDYVRERKRNEFFPRQFVINTSKLDMENEQHMELLAFMENQFKVKGKNLYHLPWELNLYRGAEELEVEDALTEQQKQMISVGLAEKSDFNTRAFGENVEEYRLAKPLLKRAYSNGALDTGLREQEALDLVCASTEDVSLADVVKEKAVEVEAEGVSEEEISDTIDSLFG